MLKLKKKDYQYFSRKSLLLLIALIHLYFCTHKCMPSPQKVFKRFVKIYITENLLIVRSFSPNLTHLIWKTNSLFILILNAVRLKRTENCFSHACFLSMSVRTRADAAQTQSSWSSSGSPARLIRHPATWSHRAASGCTVTGSRTGSEGTSNQSGSKAVTLLCLMPTPTNRDFNYISWKRLK